MSAAIIIALVALAAIVAYVNLETERMRQQLGGSEHNNEFLLAVALVAVVAAAIVGGAASKYAALEQPALPAQEVSK